MGELVPLFREPKKAGLSSLAMALFLGSWALSFVALVVAWAWLRLRAPAWPPPGAPPMPLVQPVLNTLLVTLSSVSAHLTVHALRRARRRTAFRALCTTLVLGLLFLVLQGVAWAELWNAGLRLHRRTELEPWDTGVVFAGCFYALTWFHAAHVLTGLGLLGAQLPAVTSGRATPADHQALRLSVWFWHFVTAVWFVVWPAAYML
jgi:cytochrome c oxidase subunit 3